MIPRWTVAAMLAGACVVAWSGRAAAATADRQGWAPMQAVMVPPPASQSPLLYVGVTLGSEAARTFIHIDAGVPIHDIAAASLDLSEGDDTLLAANAHVDACALAGPFEGNGQIAGTPPGLDCTLRVPAVRDGTRWSVDLGAFLPRWETQPNFGVALLASGFAATDTWRVSFDPAKTTASVTATTPAPAPAVGVADDHAEPSIDVGVPFAPSPNLVIPVVASPADAVSVLVQTPQPRFFTPAAQSRHRNASSPSALATFGVLGVAVGLTGLGRRGWRGNITAIRPVASGIALPAAVARSAFIVAITMALCALPLWASEVTTFRVGVVLIFAIAALGLHVLVNWAGELSLGHAGVVGVPAFLVANISAHQGISPILLLPVGLAAGALLGGLIALPALRTRGLYVAIVTLAAGIAIDRFLFTRTWVVGTGSIRLARPRLGSLHLDSSRALFPVVALVFIAVCLGLRALYSSKTARAMRWMKHDRDAAAAFGVPVDRYRVLAYVFAGALAGLAGATSAMWLGQVTQTSFPITLSFTYLVAVVLAGAGSVGGVIASAMLLQGGLLFLSGIGPVIDYGGPLGLIYNATRRPVGFNGIGRYLMSDHAAAPGVAKEERPAWRAWPPLVVAGGLAIGAGFIAIGLAWYHAGNTDKVIVQVQELISGGVGGLALVVVGVGLLVVHEIRRRP